MFSCRFHAPGFIPRFHTSFAPYQKTADFITCFRPHIYIYTDIHTGPGSGASDPPSSPFLQQWIRRQQMRSPQGNSSMDKESRKLLRRYPHRVGRECRDVSSAEAESCGASHPTSRRLASTMPSVGGRSPTNPGAGNGTGGRVDGRAAVAFATHSWLKGNSRLTARYRPQTQQSRQRHGGKG